MSVLWGVEIEGFYRQFDAHSWRALLRLLIEGRLFEEVALESQTCRVDACDGELFVATSKNVTSGTSTARFFQKLRRSSGEAG